MDIKFTPLLSIIDNDRGFTEEYVLELQERLLVIAEDFLTAFGSKMESMDIEFSCMLSEDLLNQVVIDAVEDLKRVVDFHPIERPNLIKEISYLAFWWTKRKPIFVPFDISSLDIDDETKSQLLNINEYFLIPYISSGLFDVEKVICGHHSIAKYEEDWKYARNFLFYYLVYRVDSPKSIEAFLAGVTLHPIWEPNSVFWGDD